MRPAGQRADNTHNGGDRADDIINVVILALYGFAGRRTDRPGSIRRSSHAVTPRGVDSETMVA
jgi:hypothetical protein